MDATRLKKPQVSRACDPCRRRKVRCNGQHRCQQCEHLDLLCTYSDNQRARSRKNALRRGTVISEYKIPFARELKSEHISTSVLVPPSSLPDLKSVALSTSYLYSLIPKYMAYVYPFNPIMTDKEIRESIGKMATDRDHAAFVYAFTGVTIDLTQSNAATSMCRSRSTSSPAELSSSGLRCYRGSDHLSFGLSQACTSRCAT